MSDRTSDSHYTQYNRMNRDYKKNIKVVYIKVYRNKEGKV